MKHTKSYIKNHPNPQFSRVDFINLNGEWDFCFDDNNVGEKEEYYNNFPFSTIIKVPYSYNYEASMINDQKIHNVVWYHKNFEIGDLSKNVIIHFEGVDYASKIFVNGHFVGEHFGGYTKFSFDITSKLKLGKNEITVRVEDDFSCVKPRGKQRWMDHNYECFYKETTGIWKSVYLEFVDKIHLDKVKITPSFKNTSVEIEYELNIISDNLELETEISFDDYIINKSRKSIFRPIFKDSFDLASDKATMKLHCWSADNPNLYDVCFRLYKNNVLIDEVKSYFGVAEFLAKGNNIYLNHNLIVPKLILDQGYHKKTGLTLDEDMIINDIVLMKNINLNGCRKHEKIESDLFYYYCDILGYYLWQELPSAYEWKNKTIENLSKEWIDILNQHYNHPSLMAYVIINESWGSMAICNNIDQQNFTKGMYYLTKSIDSNRFVISNDGWEHTISDLYTVHNYASTKQELIKEYSGFNDYFAADKRKIHTGAKTLLCENVEKEIKPCLLSEFGGIAFSKDKDIGWGYGNLVKDEEEYLQRLKDQIDAIFESEAFCGYCFTQLSDVQQEVNGLLDENHNYKVNEQILKNIFARNN